MPDGFTGLQDLTGGFLLADEGVQRFRPCLFAGGLGNFRGFWPVVFAGAVWGFRIRAEGRGLGGLRFFIGVLHWGFG